MDKQMVISKKKREKLRGDDGSQIISVRMKKPIVESVEQVAKATNRSRNEIINMFVAFALEHLEIAEDE